MLGVLELSNNGNHLKLYKFHLALVLVTFLIYLFLLQEFGEYLTESGRKAVPIVFFIPSIVHFAVALGCKYQQNWARKISVLLGALMLLFFPIGTILGFYFLPLTQWKNKE